MKRIRPFPGIECSYFSYVCMTRSHSFVFNPLRHWNLSPISEPVWSVWTRSHMESIKRPSHIFDTSDVFIFWRSAGCVKAIHVNPRSTRQSRSWADAQNSSICSWSGSQTHGCLSARLWPSHQNGRPSGGILPGAEWAALCLLTRWPPSNPLFFV